MKGGAETAAHLLEFDSVHGRWPRQIRAEGEAVYIDGNRPGSPDRPGVQAGLSRWLTEVAGLALFGLAFALNSSVHSYLILAYPEVDQAALYVGFHYMANAAGRLLGTLLSGVVFELAGLTGCLWVSAALVAAAGLFSLPLPKGRITETLSGRG